MAVFCDYENVAIGARDARYGELDIHLILERLLDKGMIVVKKAYSDWERYKDAKRKLHEAAFELIEIPHVSYSGKNSADIRLVVDALDLCYTKPHVQLFVIISGDSDFSPLVSKLRENNKRVIAVGVKSSTSDLLIENCDDFIYYDDLVRDRQGGGQRGKGRRKAGAGKTATKKVEEPRKDGAAAARKGAEEEAKKGVEDEARKGADDDARPEDPEERKLEALDLVLDTVEGLFRERDDRLWGSMVKQTLKRKRPNFSESFHGYRSFNQLLEDARTRGMLELQDDERSGGYIITGFGPNA